MANLRDRALKTAEYGRRCSEKWLRNHPDAVALSKRQTKRVLSDHPSAIRRRAWLATERGRLFIRAQCLRKYGLTEDEYQEILKGQGGGCAICGASSSKYGRRLAVDHDHSTGVIRGILCKTCNSILGAWDDDAERFSAAAKYLRLK